MYDELKLKLKNGDGIPRLHDGGVEFVVVDGVVVVESEVVGVDGVAVGVDSVDGDDVVVDVR